MSVPQVSVAMLEVPSSETPLLRELLAHLDEDERLRADRFRFAEDRWAFVAAHGLQRVMVGSFLQLPAAALTFVTPQPGGKPVLVQGRAAKMDVSISHTRGAVACAVGSNCQVGIDIEASSRILSDDVVSMVFTASERQWMASTSTDARHERAITLWTLKEAISKALGVGLALDFSRLALSWQPPWWQISNWPEDYPQTAVWALRSWSPHPGFRASLAIGLAEGQSVEIDLPVLPTAKP
jgi:4'-phosphopantetheinyl transferase